MAIKKNINSIKDALNILNEAAKEQKVEISNMISEDYEHLKNAASAIKPSLEASIHELKTEANAKKEKLQSSANEIAHDVDKYVHKNPWEAVKIASAVAFVVGFLLRSNSKK